MFRDRQRIWTMSIMFDREVNIKITPVIGIKEVPRTNIEFRSSSSSAWWCTVPTPRPPFASIGFKLFSIYIRAMCYNDILILMCLNVIKQIIFSYSLFWFFQNHGQVFLIDFLILLPTSFCKCSNFYSSHYVITKAQARIHC